MIPGAVSGGFSWWSVVAKGIHRCASDLSVQKGTRPRLGAYSGTMCRRMLPGNFSAESRAVVEVVFTATNPLGVFLPLHHVQAVLIQPNLPTPRLSRALWSNSRRAFSSIVLLSQLLLYVYIYIHAYIWPMVHQTCGMWPSGDIRGSIYTP